MKPGQIIVNKRRQHVLRRILHVNKDGTLVTQRIDHRGQPWRFMEITRVYEWRLLHERH